MSFLYRMSFSFKSVKDDELNSLTVLKSERIPIVDTAAETPSKGSIAFDKTNDAVYFADGTNWHKLGTHINQESYTFNAGVFNSSSALIGSTIVTVSRLGNHVTVAWNTVAVNLVIPSSNLTIAPALQPQYLPLYLPLKCPATVIVGGSETAGAMGIPSSPNVIVFNLLSGAFPPGSVEIPAGSVSWLASPI